MYILENTTLKNLIVYIKDRQVFFFVGPASKYFRPCGPVSLS